MPPQYVRAGVEFLGDGAFVVAVEAGWKYGIDVAGRRRKALAVGDQRRQLDFAFADLIKSGQLVGGAKQLGMSGQDQIQRLIQSFFIVRHRESSLDQSQPETNTQGLEQHPLVELGKQTDLTMDALGNLGRTELRQVVGLAVLGDARCRKNLGLHAQYLCQRLMHRRQHAGREIDEVDHALFQPAFDRRKVLAGEAVGHAVPTLIADA